MLINCAVTVQLISNFFFAKTGFLMMQLIVDGLIDPNTIVLYNVFAAVPLMLL